MTLGRGQWALRGDAGSFSLVVRPMVDGTLVWPVLTWALVGVVAVPALMWFALNGLASPWAVYATTAAAAALVVVLALMALVRQYHRTIELRVHDGHAEVIEYSPARRRVKHAFPAARLQELALRADPEVEGAGRYKRYRNPGPFFLPGELPIRFGGPLPMPVAAQIAEELSRLLGIEIGEAPMQWDVSERAYGSGAARRTDISEAEEGVLASARYAGQPLAMILVVALLLTPGVMILLLTGALERRPNRGWAVLVAAAFVAVQGLRYTLQWLAGRDILELSGSRLELRKTLFGIPLLRRRFDVREIRGIRLSEAALFRHRFFRAEPVPQAETALAFEAGDRTYDYTGAMALRRDDAQRVLDALAARLPTSAFETPDERVQWTEPKSPRLPLPIALAVAGIALVVAAVPVALGASGLLVARPQASSEPALAVAPDALAQEIERRFVRFEVLGADEVDNDSGDAEDVWVIARHRQYDRVRLNFQCSRPASSTDASWAIMPSLEPLAESDVADGFARAWGQDGPKGSLIFEVLPGYKTVNGIEYPIGYLDRRWNERTGVVLKDGRTGEWSVLAK